MEYGFDTYTGLYKAFLREFGYTPKQFLTRYKLNKPYRIYLSREACIMITHKRIGQILSNWGLEIGISENLCKSLSSDFREIYTHLPKQIIHRDPNLSNIVVGEENGGSLILNYPKEYRNLRPLLCSNSNPEREL